MAVLDIHGRMALTNGKVLVYFLDVYQNINQGHLVLVLVHNVRVHVNYFRLGIVLINFLDLNHNDTIDSHVHGLGQVV